MKLFSNLRELFSNICDDWRTYRKYGISRNEATWLHGIIRIPGFVRDLRDVKDWDQKRGVYFLPVGDKERTNLSECWHIDAGCSIDANELIKKALDKNFPFYWYVFVHVYSDGYNHKVVVADTVDPNFHMLSSYLEFTQDFGRMHFTPYTCDLKSNIG